MYRGYTPKIRSEVEKSQTNFLREGFGKDFVAKLKSKRRYGFRDWRKTEGKGDASFRRYSRSKALESKKII